LVGHKRLIYAIDKTDMTKENIRKLTVDFFKIELGFTDEEIIFIDRNAFGKIDGVLQTKFNAET
jgi:hypothetical protein